MAALRDTDKLLWPAVAETLNQLSLQPGDAAAKKLAARYAQIIDGIPDKAPRGSQDQAWAARWLMPLLLDTLRELGATPAARAAIKKGSGGDSGQGKPKSQLDTLREQRARRNGA